MASEWRAAYGDDAVGGLEDKVSQLTLMGRSHASRLFVRTSSAFATRDARLRNPRGGPRPPRHANSSKSADNFLFLPPNPSLWQELNELMEYSAKFDIRPRTRFIVTSLVLGLFSFILSCIAEEEKYSK